MEKTTACFCENDVSFCGKWRVVFQGCSDAEKTIDELPIPNRVSRSVKRPINNPSRAHAYARITGVFAFLLSQVSQHLLKFVVFQVVMGCFKRVLTNALASPPQLYWHHLDKSTLLVYYFFYFEVLFSPFCDTCDSKKTTSLLEGARVHAYEMKKIDIALICYLYYAKWGWRKMSCHFFLDFSLFEDFSTPICIGTHSRCAFPISYSTFTATANPIYLFSMFHTSSFIGCAFQIEEQQTLHSKGGGETTDYCWLNPNQWFDANEKMNDDRKLFLMIFIISQTEISGFTPIYQTFW